MSLSTLLPLARNFLELNIARHSIETRCFHCVMQHGQVSILPFNSLSNSYVAANGIFANTAIGELSKHVVATRCTPKNVYTGTLDQAIVIVQSECAVERRSSSQDQHTDEACSPSSDLTTRCTMA